LKQLSHPEVEGSTFLQKNGTFTHNMAQQPKYNHDLINKHQKTWKLKSVFSMGYMGRFKIIFSQHFQISGYVWRV